MVALARGSNGYFIKGQSGNPNGRPGLPPDVRELQEITRVEVLRAINSSLIMTPQQIKEKLEDPAATMAQHLVGSVLSKAIKEGCYARAQFLVNYVLGRPKTFEVPEENEDSVVVQQVLKGIPSSVLLKMVENGRNSESIE